LAGCRPGRQDHETADGDEWSGKLGGFGCRRQRAGRRHPRRSAQITTRDLLRPSMNDLRRDLELRDHPAEEGATPSLRIDECHTVGS
jgi:hypothetical protein